MASTTPLTSLPHEQKNWMAAFAIPIQVITTVLLYTRLMSRFQRSGGQVGLDDFFIFVAWLLGTGVTICILLSTYRYGFNRHVWDVPPNLYGVGGTVAFFNQLLFLTSTCFTKLSILMFYRRMVSDSYTTTFKWGIWAAMTFVVVYTITYNILVIATCSPVKAQWLQFDINWATTHRFKCMPPNIQKRLATSAGALSVVTDVYSVMLPALLLVRIKINKRQRWGLFFIFGLGYIVVGAGIARTFYLNRVQGDVLDKTWHAFDVYVASIAECNLAIVCACAPSLRVLLGRYFRELTSKGTDSGFSTTLSSRISPTARKVTGRLSTGIRRATDAWPTRSNGGTKNGTKLNIHHPHEYDLENLKPIAEDYDLRTPASTSGPDKPLPLVLTGNQSTIPAYTGKPPRPDRPVSPLEPENGPKDWIHASNLTSHEDTTFLMAEIEAEQNAIRVPVIMASPLSPVESSNSTSAAQLRQLNLGTPSPLPMSPTSPRDVLASPSSPRVRRKLSREKWVSSPATETKTNF